MAGLAGGSYLGMGQRCISKWNQRKKQLKGCSSFFCALASSHWKKTPPYFLLLYSQQKRPWFSRFGLTKGITHVSFFPSDELGIGSESPNTFRTSLEQKLYLKFLTTHLKHSILEPWSILGPLRNATVECQYFISSQNPLAKKDSIWFQIKIISWNCGGIWSLTWSSSSETWMGPSFHQHYSLKTGWGDGSG